MATIEDKATMKRANTEMAIRDGEGYGEAMHALKARVRNGRLVLDEPTDLPEGEIVELVPLNEILADDRDDLDDEERAALHEELEASIAEAKAGKLIDASEVLAELRSRR